MRTLKNLFFFLCGLMISGLFFVPDAVAQVMYNTPGGTIPTSVAGPYSNYPPTYNPYLPNPHGTPATVAATASGATATSAGTAAVPTKAGVKIPVPVSAAANVAKARIAAAALGCTTPIGAAVCAATAAGVARELGAGYGACPAGSQYPYAFICKKDPTVCTSGPCYHWHSASVAGRPAATGEGPADACRKAVANYNANPTPGWSGAFNGLINQTSSSASCKVEFYDKGVHQYTSNVSQSILTTTYAPKPLDQAMRETTQAEVGQSLQEKMNADYEANRRLYEDLKRDQASAQAAGKAFPPDLDPVKADTPVTVSAPPVTTPEKTVRTETRQNPDGSTDTSTTKEKVTVTPTSTGSTHGNTSITYNVQNIQTTTTVNNVTNSTTTTTTVDNTQPPNATPGEEQEEQDYSFNDPALPSVPELYQQKYPQGLAGVWAANKPNISTTAFYQGVASMFPTFGGGSCPSFGMSFGIGKMANYGSMNFPVPCWIYNVIGLIILVTAAFTARKILF